MANLDNLTREQLIERRDLLIQRQKLSSQAKPLGTSIEEARNITNPELGIENGRLTNKERISGGFFPTPTIMQDRRDVQRAALGLTQGTPLEPVGFNLANLLDLPVDIAETFGGAIPIATQIAAAAPTAAATGAASLFTGGTTTPLAVLATAGAGAGGAAFGKLVQQEIGKNVFGIDPGTFPDRAKRVGTEALLGGSSELLGFGFGKAMVLGKKALVGGANKILNRKGVRGVTQLFGRLFRNTKPQEIAFALNDIKGAVGKPASNAVIRNSTAAPTFPIRFVRRLFGQGDEFIDKMFKHGKPISQRDAFRNFYKKSFNIPEDVFNTVAEKGAENVKRATNPNFAKNLSRKVKVKLPVIFNKLGKDLAQEGQNVIANADKVAGVTDFVNKAIPQINKSIADKLVEAQMLIREGQELYSFNPNFVRTSTGKQQFRIFKAFIKDFFDGVDDVSKTALQRLPSTIEAGTDISKEALLLAGGKTGRKIVFSANKQTTFKEFAKSLQKLSVQISGKEFDAVGDLSSQLAVYLKTLRGVTAQVADTMGNTKWANLNRAYGELADVAGELRGKDTPAIEGVLRKLADAVPGTEIASRANTLNTFIKQNFKIDIINDLNLFKTNRILQELSNPAGKLAANQDRLTNIMANAFDRQNANDMLFFKETIDKFLPRNEQLALASKRHTVANALTKDITSIIKARFLMSGILGALGLGVGGPTGGAIGLGAGLFLQQPTVIKNLLKVAAKAKPIVAKRAVAPQITKAVPASTRLLQKLIQQQTAKSQQ